MIVLKEIGTAQTVQFVPTRRNAGNRLFLTNETTNVTTEYAITCTQVSYYLTFSKVLALKEGHFYTMVIQQNNELIYRDKVFVLIKQSELTRSILASMFKTNKT